LIWGDFELSNEIISECVRQLSKILPIDAYVQHVKWVFMIKMGDVRDLARDNFVLVMPLCAEPVGVVVKLILFILGSIGVLEADSYVINVQQYLVVDRHVQLHIASTEY
jgi:hypothetical protein